MKHIKTSLCALVLLPLCVGTAMAAELRIVTGGTGSGVVHGEGIGCPPFCTKTYSEKTVVHLKAEPLDDSFFEGWLIDGKTGEGVVTIDQEDVGVAAIFTLKKPPDDMTVVWYTGNTRVFSTLVLDEIAITFNKWEAFNVTTEAQFREIVKDIARHYHPQAKIIGGGKRVVYLSRPEPVAQDELDEVLTALKALKYVKFVTPMFYKDAERRLGPVALAGKILVQFPEHYTDEQIRSIESEYGLARVGTSKISNNFSYQAGENPFDMIEIANRLHLSGHVESSYPSTYLQLVPLHRVMNWSWRPLCLCLSKSSPLLPEL